MRRNLTRANNTFVFPRKSKGVSGHEIIFFGGNGCGYGYGRGYTYGYGFDTGGYGGG